jgi:stress-induced-phosphoprotein 1
MIDVLGVAMGIDLQGFSREEGSDDLPPGLHNATAPSPPPSPLRTTPSYSTSNSKPTPPPPAPEPKQEDVEMSQEDAEEAKAKADAVAEKEKGTEHYKQRRFDEAAAAFSKAWDLWPKDITFLTNLGAVYFEQGEYDKCIETCEKAVEEGRSVRSHYSEPWGNTC